MKNRWAGAVVWLGLMVFSAMAVAQTAQKPDASTAAASGIPKTPDGKPDLSGAWVARRVGNFSPIDQTEPLELTKWGLEKYIWNRGPEAANAKGVYGGQRARVEMDPAYHCYPPGLARLGPPLTLINAANNGFETLQTPGQLIVLYQFQNSVRHIYTDGREHPKNLELTWNGHSIGKWEGDTLVVDTVGLRDESWLDSGGHEHSDQLHVIERFRRADENTLEIERTLIDPVGLAKPYTTKVIARSSPNLEFNENMNGKQYDCTQFMVRKPSFGEGENGLLGIADHP